MINGGREGEHVIIIEIVENNIVFQYLKTGIQTGADATACQPVKTF